MRPVLVLSALIALVVPAVASGGETSYGVKLRSATVNPDNSITIVWVLESANVANDWLAIDGAVVRGARDRATSFRTRPITAGYHTITTQAHEFIETYSPQGQGCQASGGHWVCSMTWRSSMSVSVPSATKPTCAAPRTVGLQLKVATARIREGGCLLETVEHVWSKRPAGTVLKQVREGMAISLVVSNGRR